MANTLISAWHIVSTQQILSLLIILHYLVFFFHYLTYRLQFLLPNPSCCVYPKLILILLFYTLLLLLPNIMGLSVTFMLKILKSMSGLNALQIPLYFNLTQFSPIQFYSDKQKNCSVVSSHNPFIYFKITPFMP